MTQWLGDYAEDATVHFQWSTNDGNGASITRAVDGTVQVYKDNGVAQSVAGVTDTEDFDGLTGIHACTIDLSADAFYAVGSDYSVVLAGATIDGQTVNAVLAHFSIENRFDEVDVVKIGGGTQSATDLKDFADAGYDPATNKVQGVVLTDACTTLTGHTAQTGDNFARLGAPAAASVSADILAVDNFVDELESRLTAARAGYLDNLNIGENVAGTSEITALNDLSAADVNAEVDTALADIGLDHFIQVSAGAEEPTDGSYLDQIMHKDAGQNFDAATDSLEAIRDTAPLGTAMRGTDNAALASVCTEGRLSELDAANIPADIDAILADTGTDGVVLAAGSVTAAAVATDAIDADAIAASAVAELADGVWDEVLTSGTHDVGYSAGQRLRLLIISGATAQAGAANSITLAVTESATDHIYNQNIISIVGGTGIGQTRIIVEYNGTTKVAMVDRDWQTNPDATSVYEILPFSDALLLDHGTAQAGTASSITLAATALADNASYVGSAIFISAGTGQGQMRLITAYVGATKVATISPNWETNPDNTSVYKVLPAGRTIVESFGTDALAAINTECDTALTDYDPPTKAEMDAEFAALNDLSAAQVNAECDTALTDYDPPTKAEMDAGFAALNDPTASAIASAVGQRSIPDNYAADGAQPTIEQAILAIHQFLQERAVAATTVTVRKPDGATAAMTFTLDDGTDPTSITRSG